MESVLSQFNDPNEKDIDADEAAQVGAGRYDEPAAAVDDVPAQSEPALEPALIDSALVDNSPLEPVVEQSASTVPVPTDSASPDLASPDLASSAPDVAHPAAGLASAVDGDPETSTQPSLADPSAPQVQAEQTGTSWAQPPSFNVSDFDAELAPPSTAIQATPDAAQGFSWGQPPSAGRRRDSSGWTMRPKTEPRELVGAIEASAWLPPDGWFEQQPAAPISAVGAQSIEIRRSTRSFEYAGQTCTRCGGNIDWDGYCEQCGAKAPSMRDRYEQQPASWVAGLTDLGIRHYRNEDALALDADAKPGSLAIVLVCDGVSTSTDSDVASLAAAEAATALLRERSEEWSALSTLKEQVVDVSETADASLIKVAEVVLTAVTAANQAVLANTIDTQSSPPSCTLVAGLIRDGHALVASIGDSRSYWVPDDGEALQLSVDDSVAQEQIALGMPREQAEASPHAHVITRWLGNDAPELAPHLTVLPPQESAGYLVVCSDGLWNYASEPQNFASVIRQAVEANPDDLSGACRMLIDWANEQGGHDNITVALVRLAGKQAGASADEGMRNVTAPGDDRFDVATTRARPAN